MTGNLLVVVGLESELRYYEFLVKPGFHLDFCCSSWFFVPTKSHNEQCDAQMETSTKIQNEQQKAIMSNKRHLPVLVF